jgi:hypothetical protein
MEMRPLIKSESLLNHVLNLQRFSLANYLRFARPWTREADHLLLNVVFGIADAQTQNANRIAKLLVERHASVRPGTFPMRFTGLNDVSIRHAAPSVVEDLERTVHDLRWCAEALRDDDLARDIVQAILRDEQEHLQILRDELRHAQQTAPLEPQWVFELKGNESVERDAARQWSQAKGAGVPQPA